MVMPRRGTQSDRSKGLSSTTPACGGKDTGHERELNALLL